MLLIRFIYIVVFCFLCFSCKPPVTKKTAVVSENAPSSAILVPVEEPKVLKIGKTSFSEPEIAMELRYNAEVDSQSTPTVIENLIHRKLLETEARALGYDKDEEFLEEVETYKKIVLQKHIKKDIYLEEVKKTLYEHYKFEINASHIFIPISNYAKPEDTLALYNQLLDIRKFALKNSNFSVLAKEWSKDSKSNEKGGNLGWFSAFGLIYPLEVVAFKTPIDSISLPVRTKFGYHLLKINEKRPNSGYVKVQHIIKYLKPGYDKATFDKNYSLMDSIGKLIKKGANFNEMVKKYSDDLNSKEKNGELPIFGIGTREESTFEEASFNLKIGEISKPVRSSTGIHIIKLINTYEPDSKEVFISKMADKFVTDSRGEYILNKSLKDISHRLGLKENLEIKEQASHYIDKRILTKNWKNIDGDINKFVLFTVNQKHFLVKDFFDFLEERQKYEKWKPSESDLEVFNLIYEKYLNHCLLAEEENSISVENSELEHLLKFQKSDLLISKLLNDLVINKALEDTLAQRMFFENNKVLFPVLAKAKVTSFLFKDKDTYTKFDLARRKPKPFQLNRGIKPLYFSKNEYVLSNEVKGKLTGLILILKKNQRFIVEVGGHIDPSEEFDISELRIREIVKYLVENGLPLTRISEIDYKSNKPQDRFDWSKNQRVSFQFFSDSEFDLIKSFNEKMAGSIIFSQTDYLKENFEKKYNSPWKSGVYKFERNEKIEDIVLEIYKENSSFKNNKSEVINRFQKHLEEELLKKLYTKYNVTIDSAAVEKTIEELKKNK
jgi:peptidyl-prolyl cis-trans isomerase SurA